MPQDGGAAMTGPTPASSDASAPADPLASDGRGGAAIAVGPQDRAVGRAMKRASVASALLLVMAQGTTGRALGAALIFVAIPVLALHGKRS